MGRKRLDMWALILICVSGPYCANDVLPSANKLYDTKADCVNYGNTVVLPPYAGSAVTIAFGCKQVVTP